MVKGGGGHPQGQAWTHCAFSFLHRTCNSCAWTARVTPPDPRRLFLKISAASSPGRGQRPQQVNSRAGLCGTVYLMVIVPASWLVLFWGPESQEVATITEESGKGAYFSVLTSFLASSSQREPDSGGSVPWPGTWTFVFILLPTPLITMSLHSWDPQFSHVAYEANNHDIF